MRTHYQISETSLGSVLVISTDRGINKVRCADTSEELQAIVQAEYADAQPVSTDEVRNWIDRLLELIEDPGTTANIPVDIEGTDFQQAVWKGLRTIPAGETITYGELARRIGRPKAVRAVGKACGDNPVAVLIPCHRVIGGNGKLTGYRWGLERKQKLLDKEQLTLCAN